MCRPLQLRQRLLYCGLLARSQIARSASSSAFLKKNWKTVEKFNKNQDLCLNHFDALYAKVYGKSWPSIRLGLLSAKKQCTVLNSFVDTKDLQNKLVEEMGAVEMQHYYRKHLQSYTRLQIRQQILDNKKARKREIMAKSQNVDQDSIDMESIEVSDVSDSELRDNQASDVSGEFSSAEDLQHMFTDRRMDDDERYFINQASTMVSLNDYVPSSELISQEDSFNDQDYYDGYSNRADSLIEFREEAVFEVEENLKVYTFPRGTWDRFPSPSVVDVSKLMNSYIFDAASYLAILALDLQHNDRCADYCSAPGGKSLAMLMTMKPQYLHCNDVSYSRVARLSRVMKQYTPNISYIRSALHLSKKDAKHMVYPDTYDKILVDVPCSNDRISVINNENNLFSRKRTLERLGLPTNQVEILKSALQSVKPKGAVVYSTCTMSPVENDSVVERALVQLHEGSCKSKFVVMNLKEAYRPFRGLFRFDTKFKYGQQILPSVCSNYGPMYISKIKRLE